MRSLIVVGLCLLPVYASAATMVADQIQQDSYGQISASGQVQLEGKDIRIKAEHLRVDADSQAGVLQQATVYFDGYTLKGERLQRIDLETFKGENVEFSTCPEDEWAWSIVADEASLDKEEGLFTAKGAWFELGGVPVLYAPVWRQALSRRSGFLMPKVSNSSRRGSEFTLPFYWAGAPNWDVMLQPHWMSKRGMMSDIEWRYMSNQYKASVRLQSIYDEQTQTQRGRLLSDVAWQISPAIQANINIDAITKDDGLYVADFPLLGENVSKAYLTSTAALSWKEGRDSATLSTRYQQRLGGLSNDATLQTLPRFDTQHYFDIGLSSQLSVQQQTTRFDRISGFSGLRSGVKSSLTIPWYMQGGAVSVFWGVQGQVVGYDTQNFTSQTTSYAAVASSLQLEAPFERVFGEQQWRHEIKPVLRIDVSASPNQADIPRYDSVLLPLSITNILQGNRYSGWDRFERMQRVSLLLETSLEHKSEQLNVRRVLEGQLGLVWDDLQTSVDAGVDVPPANRVSNVLAEISWLPSVQTRLSVGGQHDPKLNDWVESHASMRWSGEQQQYLAASWQRTKASHSSALESLNVSGQAQLNQRWHTYASVQYDLLRSYTLQAIAGLKYEHACWRLGVERYQNYLAGSNGESDIGTRILLEFDGLGSFGDG
ncbi:LPS-assembly protein LptD [Ghiorsea bivora]|uniref:LPS-assembly protein LptD n=1 Tax=Ghiorsea bivora TaxID=1485545 RepID=UPI0012FD4A1D|nr:LPS assembly protein LptD [Ghiorsea bivora]